MRDRLFGLASLALAGGYYLLARLVPSSELSDSTGPAGLPMIYAAALAGLSLTLLVRSLAAQPGDGSKDREPPNIGIGRAALALAIGVLYVVVVPIIGYAAGIAALIVATAWAYGASLSVRTTIVAMSGAAALWLLFVWLLGIQQPPGWWPDLVGLVLAPPGAAATSP